MKPKNIKEFKNLIEKYEKITLEEIQKVWKSFVEDAAEEYEYATGEYITEDARGEDVAPELTGFGSCTTCTLCRAVLECCTECIYFRKRKEDFMYCCNTGRNAKTYKAIDNAKNPEELLKAFRQRAKYLRKAYFKYLI